jgi:predicted dithiol-disulfide oxidoreductase (DUF899 family)
MFAADVDGWPSAGCPGCPFFVDQIGHLAHLRARDASFVLVSVAPPANIEVAWTIPWFSSHGTDFNRDFGPTWTFLDLTPLGRQENWEDSPAGYPQTPPYEWWRRHDEYKARVR